VVLQTMKDVAKKLKFCLNIGKKAEVSTDVEVSDSIQVLLTLGVLDTFGSLDNIPWIEAWDLPKIIAVMKDMGFKSSFINVKKKEMKIGFIRSLKKSDFVK
jgi:hypothetical protein